ncbi:hypothetical protein AAVH_24704 [Aphelenchoides avenae]|nr:hypothetical protein AAVH_24704 [Aphelenchus avenae]
MKKLAKRCMEEEFLLTGYALLGIFMPIGVSLVFGFALLCTRCSDAMTAFPYLVDYMSLCELASADQRIVAEIMRRNVLLLQRK